MLTTKTEARLEALRGVGIDVSKWLQKAEDRSGSQELLSVGGEQGGREGEDGWSLKCGREGGKENYMYISWTIIVENCVPQHVCLPLSHFPLHFSPSLPSLTFLPFSPPPSPLTTASNRHSMLSLNSGSQEFEWGDTGSLRDDIMSVTSEAPKHCVVLYSYMVRTL